MTPILTIAHARDGLVTRASLEALGAARLIGSNTDSPVAAVLIGANLDAAARALIAHGAQTVYLAEDDALADYHPEHYAAAVQAAAAEQQAAIVLAVADDMGRDLLPRVSHRLAAATVTEVTDIRFEDGEIRWVRPVYGGKAYAAYAALGARQAHLLRARMFEPTQRGDHKGEVKPIARPLDPAMAATRFLEKLQESTAGLRLEDARIVVAGGRGVGSAEGFARLKELAEILGGAVGGSRAVADYGWLPATQLVGQTGKMIAPDLYIAVGISGASQHLAGIAGAKTVVAINKDPEAPIFKRADLGLVVDWQAVFPHLIEKCRALARKTPL